MDTLQVEICICCSRARFLDGSSQWSDFKKAYSDRRKLVKNAKMVVCPKCKGTHPKIRESNIR